MGNGRMGAMVFGEVRSAILSPKSGTPHRAYAPGEMVGESRAQRGLVLEKRHRL